MSRRLITQLADDQPRVLLVGRESPLKQKLVDYLKRQDLEVVELETPTNNSSQDGQDFYKVILLGSGQQNSDNLKFISSQDNVVVITLTTSLDEEVFSFDLPSQIVGVDVVEDQYLAPNFSKLFLYLEQGLLINPQVNFYLQSQDNFLTQLKQFLLLPKKEKVVILGQKHSSQVVLSEVIRLLNLFYKTDNLQIKDSLDHYQNVQLDQFVTIHAEAESLPGLLESLVRHGYRQRSRENNSPVSKKDFHDQNLVQPAPVIKHASEPKPIIKVESRVVRTPETVAPVEETVRSTSIDDRLNQIFKDRRVDEKVERVQEFVQETKKIKKVTKKRKILFSLGSLITFLAGTILVLAGVFWFSTRSVERQLAGVFAKISQGETVDYSKLNQTATALEKQALFYSQFLPPEMMSDAENTLEITKKIADYEKLSSEYQAMILNSVKVVLGEDLLKDTVDAQKQAKLSQSLQEVSSKLLSRLNDLKKTKSEAKDLAEVESFIDLISQKKNALLIYQQLSPVLETLFGQDKKKTYALVFQNNQELRPTGGFVQAVAIITVDQGMIVDTQVYSSYELDQRLGGAVVPPDEIIKLLGENKWYLRDSNWDPDFSKSGKQMAWFLEQELNKKIDGVIGINLLVLQNLLRELGPIDLAEYNEVITDKNLFERSEFHSEIKLVDTSKVEDYQAKLLKYTLRDLLAKGQENPQKLLAALKKSLQEKQMTLYFSDSDLAAVFSGLGWSGEIVVPQCPTQLSTLPCHVDALVVNEANIGINKANFHTTRQDRHEIEIANNQIQHQRLITLNNEAFSNAWPKGEYRAFFRFYLPEHAQAVDLAIDGQKIKEKEVVIAKQGNHLVLGLLVSTPIKSKKEIKLTYSVPLEFSQPYSYVFFSQKQPGTADVLQNVILRYSANLSPTLIAPKAEVSGDTINYHNMAEDHAFVGVSFK